MGTVFNTKKIAATYHIVEKRKNILTLRSWIDHTKQGHKILLLKALKKPLKTEVYHFSVE